MVTDHQMPGMDGEELARKIMENPEISDTRMVLLSSLGQRMGAARIEQAGFWASLTKPLRQAQLREVLSVVMGREERAYSDMRKPIATLHADDKSARRSVRILLAEDNTINQEVALAILKKLGYRADVAADGLEAIEALSRVPYDLVLMDCQMPEMDGFEASQRIRDAGSSVLNHRVPIIAMTANAMQGDRERCIDAGMDDYLSKPVQPRELAEALDRWLFSSAKAGDGQKAPPSEEAPAPPADNEVFHESELLERLMDDRDLARTIVAPTELPVGAMTALAGAQILFYPTAIGWSPEMSPAVRTRIQNAWETVQRGHAIANGVFVAAVNRVGIEGDIEFWGNSFVADPSGEVIARADSAKEETLVVDCDLNLIEETRRNWPFLRDRRIDAYQDLTRRFRS